jgi:hypothetical protein
MEGKLASREEYDMQLSKRFVIVHCGKSFQSNYNRMNVGYRFNINNVLAILKFSHWVF